MTAPARPQGLARRLVAWQRRHGRHDLPWQGTRDAYRVWLSEVMLQQTQVGTVLGYYERFLESFPTVQALAAASLDDVLALWSGLGYYSRARNLHACARAVVSEHGGAFPTSSGELARLPGIGESTAAAIAVFCFSERAAILDGNVKRVLARVLAFEGDLANTGEVRRLWSAAQDLVPRQDVEAYTQGLMDLGATVCTLREPRCTDCPLQTLCAAHRLGQEQRYPIRTRRLKRHQRANAWLLLMRREALWLTQRPQVGVWAGLWSLPEFDSVTALQAVAADWPGRAEVLPSLRHSLTHFDWTLTPVRWRLPARAARSTTDAIEARLAPGRWVSAREALALGLPAPLRKLLNALS